MSQRLGMADGRCFGIYTTPGLLNDYIMKTNGIDYTDNYSYRKLILSRGPELLNPIFQQQQVGPVPRNSFNQCMSCDLPLLKVPHTY